MKGIAGAVTIAFMLASMMGCMSTKTVETEKPARATATKWDAQRQKRIDDARGMEATDPVNAFCLYRSLLQGKTASEVQKREAEELQARVRERALEIVKRDYEDAAAKNDLAEVCTIFGVARKIQEDAIPEAPAKFLAMKADVFNGKTEVPPVWKLSNVMAYPLENGYSEGSPGMTIRPADHTTVLAVDFTIENISDSSERSYAQWGFSDAACALALDGAAMGMGAAPSNNNLPLPFQDRFAEAIKGLPYHWICPELFSLVSDAGDTFDVACVHKDCNVFHLSWNGYVSGNAVRRNEPVALAKGLSANLKLLFVVPKEMRSFRLFVLGTPPVPLTISAAPPTFTQK